MWKSHSSLSAVPFHSPAAESYTSPYSSDHPCHIHINISHQVLLCDVPLRFDIYAFDKMRLYIEMTLLLDDCSLRPIKHHSFD